MGLDNIFIIADAEKAIPSYVSKVEVRVALALKETGPSIFIVYVC